MTDDEAKELRGYIAELRQRNTELRRYNVSIMDVGECLTTLGSIANQTGAQADAASASGVAVGLRRAAHRILHNSTERFGEEIDLLQAYQEAMKRGVTHEQVLAFLIGPKDAATMLKVHT